MANARLNLRSILLCSCVLAAPAAAVAQDRTVSSAGTTVADVVVTARARTERLIDAPVVANVLSQAALQRSGAVNISDIAKQVPQLEISVSGAGSGASVSMRGISTSAIDAGLEQPVSLVLDGVGTSRGRLIFLGLFDVQSVEALKGPQALFFGKNSPAGVISLNTASPGRIFEGYGKASYDFRDHGRYLEGAASIPVNDTLAFRVAGRAYQSRGWIENTAVPQPDPLTVAPDGTRVMTRPAEKWLGGSKSVMGRITARWTPTEDFEALLKVTDAHTSSDGSAAQNTIVRCAPGATLPSIVIGPLVDPTGTCAVDFKTSIADLPLKNMIPYNPSGRAGEQSDTFLTSLNMHYRMGPITLTSITGYINFRYANAGNFDYGSYAVLWGALRDRMESFTEEVRAVSSFDGPLNFTAGALYEHTHRFFGQDIKVPGFTQVNGRYDNALSNDVTIGQTYSAYAQLSWKIRPDLELSGGARYTHETKDGTLQNVYLRPGANFLPTGVVLRPAVAADNVSPEVTLSWHPTTRSTIYGAYKTGFLSGGISNPGNLQATITPAALEFRPEKVRGGEIGAKGQFFNDRLTLTSDVYDYKYRDIQVISFEASTFSYTTKNAASARVKGAEVQATWLATPDLSLRGAVSYNHGRFISFPNAQCYAGQTAALGCVAGRQDLSGTQLGVTPDWSGSAGLTFEHDVTEGLRGQLNIDGYYRGHYNFTAANTYRPGMIQHAQVRLDASARLFQPGKGFEVALVGRNLTNRKTILLGSDTPAGAAGQVGGFLGRPREISVEATYRF